MNNETGLPSLDHLKGEHFWEVKKFGDGVGQGFYLVLYKVEDCVKASSEIVTVDNPEAHWWNNKPKTVGKVVKKEVEDTKNVSVKSRYIGDKDEEAYEIAKAKARGFNYAEPSPSYYRTLNIDEEMIRETALEILSEIDNQNRVDRFVGKYPPKKLGE